MRGGAPRGATAIARVASRRTASAPLPRARRASAKARRVRAARDAARRLALGAAADAHPAVPPRGRSTAACAGAFCISSTSRWRPQRAAACAPAGIGRARSSCSGGLPATGGPLLVLSLNGRHIRAQETTLWMTRTALRALPTLPAPLAAHATAARAGRERPRRPRRPAAGQAGPVATLVEHLPRRRLPLRHRLARAGRDQPRRDRTSASNTHVSSAGAVGWMQFLPSTWRRWGIDGSGDGIADPYDPADAIFSAARYLHAAGAERDIRRAVFAYNHADWYVNEVLSIAAAIPDGLRRLEARAERDRSRDRVELSEPAQVRAIATRRRRHARSNPRPQRVGVRVRGEHAPTRSSRGRRPTHSAQRKRSRASSSSPASPSCAAVARPPAPASGCRAARARPRAPSARAARARPGTSGHGRSAGRSTAGPLQSPHTGHP